MSTPDQPPHRPFPPQHPGGQGPTPQGWPPAGGRPPASPPYNAPAGSASGSAGWNGPQVPQGPAPRVGSAGQPQGHQQFAAVQAGPPAGPSGKQPVWRRGWVIGLAALLVGLALGSMAGRGGGAPAPAPTVTVTTTASAQAPAPAPTVTVTATAETVKEKTPASCIKALDLAARVMSAVGDEHQAMAEVSSRVAKDGNIVRYAEGMSKAMQDMTEEITALQPDMVEAVGDCRAKA